MAETERKTENISDYCRWRGDLSFEERPLNVIDSFVLCELSYVDFSRVITEMDPKGRKLSDCAREIEERGIYALKNLYGGEEQFFKACASTVRFGSLLLRNYMEIFDEGENIQFAAMEFDLGNHISFIAFRGTDNSITGWKEDFMTSFTRIPSQTSAAEYLAEIFEEGRLYYIGGHSKGGNLARYAAAHLKDEQLPHILHVYDLDGPGFSADTFDMSLIHRIDLLTTRVLPCYCVIGKVFETPVHDTHIIASSQTGILQHDLVSWKLDGLFPVYEKKHDQVSEWISRTVHVWVKDVTKEERQLFVDEFFDMLRADGAETVQEIGTRNIVEVLRSMMSASDLSKKLLKELAAAAVTAGFGSQSSG